MSLPGGAASESNPPAPAQSRPLDALPHLALGVSIGIQLTIAAIVLLGPREVSPHIPDATPYTNLLLETTEIDIPLYLGGCALTVFIGLGLALIGPRLGAQGRAGALRIAAVSLIAFLAILGAQQPTFSAALFAPPCAAAILLFVETKPRKNPRSNASPLIVWLLDAMVIAALIALVVVPPWSWHGLSDQVLRMDDLYYHWNFFVMGPALGYLHGGALGTQVYSQYGIAWPVLFVNSGRWMDLTYDNLIGWGTVFGAAYIVGIYFFLRYLIGKRTWAFLGAILAIIWQLFSSAAADQVVWAFPSSTMLRHPLDLLFFACLLAHYRQRRSIWIWLAGTLAGCSLAFELDTGIYLVATGCLYLLLTSTQGRSAKQILLDAFGCAAAIVVGFLPWLWIASRGTLFTGAFWSGYLAGLSNQGLGGLGFIPVANSGGLAILFFAVISATYLWHVCISLWIALSRRVPPELDTMLGCISAYGLATMLLYVGRSHLFNLFHPIVPFAIVLAANGPRVWRWMAPEAAPAAMPLCAAAVVLVVLFFKPQFKLYPSLLMGKTSGNSAARDATDIEIPPQSFIDEMNAMSLTSQRLRALPPGTTVAILDDRDTFLYYASGLKPYFAQTPMFDWLLTWHSVNEVERKLLEHPPQIIALRSTAPDPRPVFDQVRAHFRAFVRQHYSLIWSGGGFELWRPN